MRSPRPILRSLLSSPLGHFLAIGGVVYLARPLSGSPRPEAPRPFALPAGRIERLLDEFTRTTGRAPTTEDRRTLASAEVDAELLYREALALGLDRGDPSIRWQLAEKMGFLEGIEAEADDARALFARARGLGFDRDDPVIRRMLVEKLRLLIKAGAADSISDDALRARWASHPERYRVPERLSLRHVYFSRDRRGATTHTAARAALDRLTVDPHAEPGGDAFPLGTFLPSRSRAQLAAVFGEAFAAAAISARVGEWTGPVDSAYGTHLVLVTGVDSATDPPFSAVRSRLLAEERDARGRERLATYLAHLRAAYGTAQPGEGGPGA